jgi:TRAP transporter TAXI family solute receptor
MLKLFKKFSLFPVIIIIIASMIICGCSQPKPTPPTPTPSPAPTPGPAPVPSKMKDYPKDAVFTSLPGAALAFTQGLTSLVSKELSLSAKPLNALNVPAAKMIGTGEADLGQLVLMEAIDAINGAGGFKAMGKIPVRVLLPFNISSVHLATWHGSGITKVEDVRGKRFMGDMATSPWLSPLADTILEFHGMSRKDVTIQTRGTNDDAMNALRDKTTDLLLQSGSFAGSSYWMELCNSVDVDFISMSDAELSFITKKHPFMTRGTVPPNVYRGQNYDITTTAYQLVECAHRDTNDDFVYKVMKVILDDVGTDKPGRFLQYNKDSGSYTLKSAVAAAAAVPYHAAAIKYFKDRGVWTPELEAAQKRFLTDMGESR